ncbi:MAG TPA: hypothetical protein VGR71_17670 [Nitrospira sp.]|nr:hypothetical protein [Nitrospira sp.]
MSTAVNGALSDTAQHPHSLTPTYVEQNQSGSEQLATVQIQSRYQIARRFPRDLDLVRQNMLKECHRPSFCMPDMKKNGSSVAIYRVPRAGTNIEGVTIRFAEMAARNFGNIGIDLQQLGEDNTQRIYLVTATDYETNLISTEIVNVPRTIERKYIKDTDLVVSSRTNSKGEPVHTIIATDDDIAMKRNALVSKAKRNLIMGFIPGWLVEECVDTIRDTAAKKDAEDPDKAKRDLFDAFATLGVNADMLKEFIGHTNPLQPLELETLRGYFGGMKEQYTTWAEIAATKGDDKDGTVAKEIDALLSASGRTVPLARKLRASYAGRPQELLTYLKDEAAKKANTGAAQTDEKKADPAATEEPAPPPPPADDWEA